MNKTFLALGFLLFSVGLMAQTMEMKVTNATVAFVFLDDNTEGTLTDVDATVSIDFTNLDASNVQGTVNVSTLSTGNKVRDKHLLSADFFEEATYPTMSFQSTSLYSEGQAYKAKGNLTAKGETREVIFDVKSAGEELIFTTEIFANDFGITKKKDKTKSKVRITVTISAGN